MSIRLEQSYDQEIKTKYLRKYTSRQYLQNTHVSETKLYKNELFGTKCSENIQNNVNKEKKITH